YMADGTVEVTGEGAEWINSSSLNVGYGSTGTLTIAAGGRVESSDGGIGYNGNGTVVVTGENSIWVIAGDEPDEFGELDIGIFGTGGLTIADGGRVESTAGYLGYL